MCRDARRSATLEGAQHQVIILAALIADPHAAQLGKQAATVNPKMADHVVAMQQVEVPVGLEIRLEA